VELYQVDDLRNQMRINKMRRNAIGEDMITGSYRRRVTQQLASCGSATGLREPSWLSDSHRSSRI
jgi:hypothetical protein